MNRIITILVTIFILLLLYIWISHVWGSDKTRHPRQIVDAKESEIADNLISDADTMQMSDQMGDQMGDQGMDEALPVTEEKKQDAVEEVKTPKVEEKKVEEPKKVEPKPTPKKTESTTPKSKPTPPPSKPATSVETSTSATGEQHLVIAGNFTQKANAEQRVKELKKAGFPDTEVVNFDLSEYYTVCVGRFSDVNEARKLVKKLKDYHKIDAYVRIGG
jgi:cell division protein FtsN